MKRMLFISDFHYCQEIYGEISIDEKARRLINQINDEHKKHPIDYILMLGDYSLDYWGWFTKGAYLTKGESYTARFFERYAKALPAPYFALAGNHEQYGEQFWKQITGNARSGAVTVGDTVFIMWDSYGADLDPTDHSDGTYTPPNVNEIRKIMDKNKGKRFILCSHYFNPCYTKEEIELINEPSIACLFIGHTHYACTEDLPTEYGGKKMIHCGSYAGISPAEKYPWGLRDLYIDENGIESSYLVAEHSLFQNGKSYTIQAHTQDEIKIFFEKG